MTEIQIIHIVNMISLRNSLLIMPHFGTSVAVMYGTEKYVIIVMKYTVNFCCYAIVFIFTENMVD